MSTPLNAPNPCKNPQKIVKPIHASISRFLDLTSVSQPYVYTSLAQSFRRSRNIQPRLKFRYRLVHRTGVQNAVSSVCKSVQMQNQRKEEVLDTCAEGDCLNLVNVDILFVVASVAVLVKLDVVVDAFVTVAMWRREAG